MLFAPSVGAAPGVGATVESAEITNDSIVDADINSSAAIALSKLATPATGPTITTAVAAAGSASATANLLYYATIVLPWAATITGVNYYVYGTANGNVRSALYNSAGTSVASRTTNSAQPGTFRPHQVAFDSTYAAAAGIYFAALIFSSSTATISSGNYLVPSGSAAQGGFSVPASITPPTTPETAIGSPMMAIY